MALKENYKDDILDVSVNTKRKYRMTENADGTISLDDETVYTQEGDSFGATDMNATNTKVNAIDDSLMSKLLYTEITSLTTIGDVIDYIVANENIPLGTTRKYSIYNTTLNGYDIEITHANLSVERYTGTALSNHGNDNYTFYKEGGASTVTNPFKKGATLVGTYSGNQTINVSSYLKSGDTVNNFIVEFVKINSGNSVWYDGNSQIVCQVRNLGSTLSKTLSGNNLIISGATNKDEVWKADNTSGSNPHAITAVNVAIQYKVWYV